jgi:hypothetical protein
VLQDSCPTGQQTFNVVVTNSLRVCATDVPSAPIPNQTSANYCTTSDPSDPVNCPASHYRTAHLNTPLNCGIPAIVNSSIIQSVYFSLRDATTLYGNAVGPDPKTWLKSPQGTYLLLASPRPFNSLETIMTCYCPTFTPIGTDGVLPNFTTPYNQCNYTPEGGSLGAAFVGQDPFVNSGIWTLYVNDNDSAGGSSFGSMKIGDFCMTFNANLSSNTSYTWSSDSVNWLAYLSSLNISNPVFTPPAGYYDFTYYVTVSDTTCGCSGIDTVHVSCPAPLGIAELNHSIKPLTVTMHGSEISFTYPSSDNAQRMVLYDITGKEITGYQLAPHSSLYTARALPLSRGVYLVRLINSDSPAVTKFFVE